MRTFDVMMMNSLANDPEIRPWLLGEGRIELEPQIKDVNNFAFLHPEGYSIGFLYERVDVITAEVHTISRPGMDFPMVLEFTREVLDWVMINTTIERVYTKVSRANPGARVLANRMGFHNWHQLDRLYQGHVLETLELSLDRWAVMCSRAASRGKAFHAELGDGKTHEDDEVHDHVVGAAILMAEAGNPIKGLDLYNRWAKIAGYEPVGIVSAAPLVIDIHTHLVGLNKGRMEIL